MAASTLRVRGLDVAASVRPGANAIVFVHGLAASRSYFADASSRPELAAHGLLTFDLPGYGQTPPPEPFDYSMHAQAELVAELVARHVDASCTLVAHSMGGTIGILAAEMLGSRIRRLVLAEAGIQSEPDVWSARIASATPEAWSREFDRLRAKPEIFARGAMLRRDPAAVRRISPALLDTSAVAMQLSARSLQDTVADPTLYGRTLALPIPTTFVFGDRNLDYSIVDRLRRDGARIETVPRAGHLMMLDNPAVFYSIVANAAL